MKKFIFLLLCIFTQSLFAGSSFEGIAKNIKDSFVYKEEHKVEYDEKGLVKKIETNYVDANGKLIGVLKSQFDISPYLPQSQYIDSRNGRTETTSVSKDEIKITITEPNKEKKDFVLKREDNMVMGQGYHNYILDHLNEFKSNEKRKILFVLPDKGDAFSFQLKVNGPQVNNPDFWDFRLEISNFLFGLFLDPISVTYSKKDRRLLAYDGLTNIVDDQGKNYQLKIKFNYPEKQN